jgi:hypothetical protein
MADHEIGRVALAVVPVLFAELEPRDVRRRQQLDLVARRLEGGAKEPFVFPRQPAEQDSDARSFGCCKRPLNRTMEVPGTRGACLGLKATPLGRDLVLNLFFNFLAGLEVRTDRWPVRGDIHVDLLETYQSRTVRVR